MQATGTLTVRVYTSQAQIPIEGATVVVTAPGKEGKLRLLSIQVTDSSGIVRTIRVDAPAPGESTAPNGTGEPAPFAVCDVWAEHPNYAILRVEGVQIFPGVETIQDMELMPLTAGQCSLQHRGVREITSQNL